MTTGQFARKQMAGLSVQRRVLEIVRTRWASEFDRRQRFVDQKWMTVMTARTPFGQMRAG
jgi:hypothetical protein